MGPRSFTILAVTFTSCIVVLLPDFTSTSVLDDNFIRKSNNNVIACPMNSVIVTNESTRMSSCNDKNCCEVGNDKIFYVCLKEQYSFSNCRILNRTYKISENGCYTYQRGYNKIEISIIKTSLRYLHIFVLGMSVKFFYNGNLERTTTFGKASQEIDKYRIQLENHTRFLLKVSNSTEEDFSDFLINSEDSKNVGSGCLTKHLMKMKITSTQKNEDSTSNPPKTSPVASKVFIILGAIVIILLTLILLITCFFYRKKRHQQSQKLNVMESSEQDNQDVLAEGSLYENTSTQQSLSKVNSSNIAMQDVYAVVDKKKKITPDDPHGFAPHGGPSDQAADSGIYANVTEGNPQMNNGQQLDGLVREEVNGEIYTLIVKEASI